MMRYGCLWLSECLLGIGFSQLSLLDDLTCAFFYNLYSIGGTMTCTDNLIAVDGACGKEIGNHLIPECAVFGCDVLQGCSHAVESDEAPYAKCAGEEPREALPVAWNVALRPRYSTQEEQWNGCEDDE